MPKALWNLAALVMMTTTVAAPNASAAGVSGEADSGATSLQDAGISEVIVTASRREENIQKTALSVQALSSDVLERANVGKPEDLAAVAPGVQVGSAGSYAQAYIRGVGNYATNSFAESSVAFNLDGVYISRSWAVRGAFYDLERVEVLKGPQGTLYGRNASGGAINIITVKPKLGQFGGFGEMQVGNYGLIQGTAALNLPVGDTLAIRASGMATERDGYLSDGTDDDKTTAARLQMLWEPNANISLLLSGHYQHIGGMGGASTLMPQLPGNEWRAQTDPAVIALIRAQPGIGPLLTVPGTDAFADVDVYAITGELNWNLGFGTMTVLPAYRGARQKVLHYNAGFSVRNGEQDEQTSLEVRLGNGGEQLKWVLGGYYFDEQISGLPKRSNLFVNQGISTQDVRFLDFGTRSLAAFGQGTYSLTDQLRVTGGLRYTYERKVNDEQFLFYNLPNQSPPPLCGIVGSQFDPTSPVPPQFCRLTVDVHNRDPYNSVTWKAGLEYDVAPRSMAYVSAGTGFKSGGVYTAAPPNHFDAEKLTSFEAGVKNRFLDDRLQVNAEAFLWKYKDHQESFVGPTAIPGVFTFITVNAGKATLYGGDLDVLFRATQRDELSLKVQYEKSNYDSFAFDWLTQVFGPPVTGCAVLPSSTPGRDTVDCSGQSLIRAPVWSGTAGYGHTFNLGDHGSLEAHVAAQFASGTHLAIEFVEEDRQGAYAIGNLDVTYKSPRERWLVSAFGHNIWNEAVYNQTFHYPFVAPTIDRPNGLFFGSLRPPRTYGVRMRVNF